MREDADELLEQKVNVRKEDSAIKDFIIPYSTEEMMGSGGWLVNIRKVVIAGIDLAILVECLDFGLVRTDSMSLDIV